MARAAKDILERLGASGLNRALDDLLDQARLVRLANTCGLKYRGMRTKSQSRARLLKDLVDKAHKQDDVGKAVLRALDKETGQAAQEWSGLETDEKVRRLCDVEFLSSDGNAGRHIYLLATGDDAGALDGVGARLAHEQLLRVTPNGARSTTSNGTSRGESRLKRQVQERERKVRHLEAQLAKTRETQKTIKQDLIQRKGELAESRMLAERLRQELAQARSAVQAADNAGPAGASEKAVLDLVKSVRRLATEQKKLAHALAPLAGARRGNTDESVLRTLVDGVKRLDDRVASEASEREKRFDAIAKRVDGLRNELRAGPAKGKAAKPTKRVRTKGQAPRVGVFIDVQNMYYGARRLKGKLDFDALLEAAIQERRHIKTTAYVVESKETDQSQFIRMLQKRGIEVRRKTLQVRADGSMKGDWDMELAFDILDASPSLDVVVLVSGDGDFTSLIKRVKSMGPRVEVVAFPRNTAKSLVQAADSFQPLDRKFMIYSRTGKEPPKAAASGKAAAKPAAEATEAKGPSAERSEKAQETKTRSSKS